MHAFEQALANCWPPAAWRDVRVVVAVSGGSDSVALLRGLQAIAAPGQVGLTAVHFNHGLRPEACHDEAFVAALCGKLGIPCELGRGGVQPLPREGLEAAARRTRYAYLRQAAHQLGARYLAVGHTADDQAETVLHRIVRGAGLEGLRGMPRVRRLSQAVTLVRPMLAISRTVVRDYLAELGQDFCEDAMNADLRYLRSRIRHELIPLLRKHYNPRVADALLRLAAAAAEAQELVEELVDKVRWSVSQTPRRPDQVELDCAALANQPRAVVRALCRAVWREQGWPERQMTFAHWDTLVSLALGGPSGARAHLPRGIQASREGGKLRMQRAGESPDQRRT